jgi:hypothetical protein
VIRLIEIGGSVLDSRSNMRVETAANQAPYVRTPDADDGTA